MRKHLICLSGALPEIVRLRVATRTPGLVGKTLLFLTDLHYGKWMRDRKMARIIALANQLAPDFIVLGGDLAENRQDEALLCTRHLNRLRAPLGVYCVPGNNDYEAFEGHYGAFEAMLAAAGVRLMVNERAVVPVEGGALVISGLDESKYGHPDRAVLAFPKGPGDFHLLATHSPWALDHVMHDAAQVDLALCGHTHAGQLALGPLTVFQIGYDRKAIATRKYFFLKGDHMVDGTRLIVSGGIGCSVLPLRVGAPPEMHLIGFEKSDNFE